MTFSDDLLIAYINGDLAEPARAAVERATHADPILAARVAQHRAELRNGRGRSVGVSANGHDGSASAQRPVPQGAKVVHLNTLRPGRPMPLPPPAPTRVVGLHWVTLTAALLGSAILGAVGWHHLGQGPGLAVLDHDNGVLVARGALVAALDDQLATPGPSDSGVRIGVTFVAKDGGYCRSFVVDTTAGLACLRRGRWTIPVLSQGTAGAAWLDGSIPPPAVRAAIEARMAGSALDPAAERAARQRGWAG